ncbi:fimbria/pilus periplasmic chaperone [[Enterobacter] lignolyticus]|uniref:Pili assembly chaperone, N-terminal protein n=1 Tax=Enterobacter lignolyticus (strain SCF1) TaxID=701347 RepID=E3G2H3_ENTLS|nr:fimbria/pilus periplasmic chaperone [[Enterobacter] lignolyticus]ADO46912.1 Pili assembly chaperone, N-terminal protein [[Enterobacter] lignolyticus SCF1]
MRDRSLIFPLLLCLAGALLLFSAIVQAGVVIGGTRFVYAGGQKSISVSVRNKSQAPFLVNARVATGGEWQGVAQADGGAAPFVVTPPLLVIQPQRENIIRIIYTGGPLPADRESLFTLSIAAIPASKAQANSVQLAVRSALKLIYRPTGLKGDAASAYSNLRWRRDGAALRVSNPGPYYVTLFQLSIAGKSLDNAGVVAPFGERRFSGCPSSQPCRIRWQSINDYGRVMPPAAALLQPSGR